MPETTINMSEAWTRHREEGRPLSVGEFSTPACANCGKVPGPMEPLSIDTLCSKKCREESYRKQWENRHGKKIPQDLSGWIYADFGWYGSTAIYSPEQIQEYNDRIRRAKERVAKLQPQIKELSKEINDWESKGKKLSRYFERISSDGTCIELESGDNLGDWGGDITFEEMKELVNISPETMNKIIQIKQKLHLLWTEQNKKEREYMQLSHDAKESELRANR
jgi:hypothetical protein